METLLDQRLQQAAFDRLEAAKELHNAREAKRIAIEAFDRAAARHTAAVENHCNVEQELAAGITRQSRLELPAGRVAA